MIKAPGWTCAPRSLSSSKRQHSHPPPSPDPRRLALRQRPAPPPWSPPPSSHPFLSRLKGSTRRLQGVLRLPLGVPNRDCESGLRVWVRVHGTRGWARRPGQPPGSAPSAHRPQPRDRLGTLGNLLPSGRCRPSPRCMREAWGAGGVRTPARDAGPLRRWAGRALTVVISIY